MEKVNKPIYKKWWFWVIVVLFLGMIGNIIDPSEEEQPVVKEEPQKQKDVAPVTKQEEPKKQEDIVSLTEKVAKKQLKELEYVKFNEDNGYLLIRGEGKENLTSNMTVNGLYLSIFTILKEIHGDEKIKTAAFNLTLPLVDQYGNSSSEVVLKLELKRETLDKINYEKFNYENLESIADYFWSHPAIK